MDDIYERLSDHMIKMLGKKMLQAVVSLFAMGALFVSYPGVAAPLQQKILDFGLTAKDYRAGEVPTDWKLRKRFGLIKTGTASWTEYDGIKVVRLSSEDALTFLERKVDIDIRQYPIVTWKWRVDNILEGIDERTPAGDDHPIRLFFVFEPDPKKQSLWFRVKRFLYLDVLHGHPYGGRFMEYLWSSHLESGEILNDPGKPWQKLMVIEGGRAKIGRWLTYERNLYKDFKRLYGQEPRKLVFIGILNDTDQTGLSAVSYISDFQFRRAGSD